MTGKMTVPLYDYIQYEQAMQKAKSQLRKDLKSMAAQEAHAKYDAALRAAFDRLEKSDKS